MNKAVLLYVSLILQFSLCAQTNTDSFIRGVDISFTPQIENLGGKYKLNGAEKDALDIFKESGANYVRLRLWHTPSNGYCGLEKTLAYAKRVKAKGFKFLLDIHYSDSWADPGKQNKPAAWASASYAALKESVYTYTKYVIAAMKNQGTTPDMVQIGNEITGGMLWPDGKVSVNGWQHFAELVKQGILGVKDAAGSDSVKIMIHIDRGGDNNGAKWFYDNLLAQGVQFDVIGLSYYPWWHGTLTQAENNLNDLSTRYNKDIVIAECAYPWTLQYADNVGNIVGNSSQVQPGYPATVKGQKDFLFALSKLIKETNNKKGVGFFYWEPSYISVLPLGSSWENCTTFDFSGNALNSLFAFANLDTLKSFNTKIRINTSTLGDTITTNGFVQVRGEVQGISSSVLPSGDAITWDATSQIVLKNVGGDYWEYQFKMYPSDQLHFKLWTGHDKNTPSYRNLGWEGPTTPFDGSSNNERLFIAGAHDTTLEMQYVNSSGEYVNQYWSPIQTKNDSLGVLFRVNVADLMNKGVFDPTTQGPIAVRGDSVSSAGILSWSSDKVIMKRETLSVTNGSFWSGVTYFPKAALKEGTQIKYKFFVEQSSFGGSESGIIDRVFNFPESDTTLPWRFFNDGIALTRTEERTQQLPVELLLFQNYPNPFNPETSIKYSLAKRAEILLYVCNLLGQKMKLLVQRTQEAGTYSISWDGTDESGRPASSGVYFVRLDVDGTSKIRKMVLLR
jgi:arabinogalactan endo-1,4-beta-galactosidase